jgi:hypothetical protein
MLRILGLVFEIIGHRVTSGYNPHESEKSLREIDGNFSLRERGKGWMVSEQR